MSRFEWGMEMTRKMSDIKINRIAVIFIGLCFEEVTEISLYALLTDVTHRPAGLFYEQA